MSSMNYKNVSISVLYIFKWNWSSGNENSMELRNHVLLMIGVTVGKHVHGVFPICKKLNIVSLTLGITSII